VVDTSTNAVVGDGKTTLFWVDKWLDGKTIKEKAPKLFGLVPNHALKCHTVKYEVMEHRWIANMGGALSL
jgi:hypothetical protein